MKTFFELAQSRRSIRKFTEQPVEQEKIDKIMQVALMAPSGKRINPWKFILVTDKEMLQKLSEARPHGSQLIAGAPLAVVVVTDTTLTDVWTEDAAIVSSYIQLEVEELELGSCWVQVRNRMNNDNTTAESYIRNLLNIPQKYAVENMVAIGYKTEEKFPHDLTSLQYDKISREKYTLAEGESFEETDFANNAIKQENKQEEFANHPHNKRLLLGSILAFFGLLFFVKRLNIFSGDFANMIFSFKSYLIYTGIIFICLKNYHQRNLRTGILLVGIGLLFWCVDFVDWLWITFNIWNYWPLILTIAGVLIVYFALKNGRKKQ